MSSDLPQDSDRNSNHPDHNLSINPSQHLSHSNNTSSDLRTSSNESIARNPLLNISINPNTQVSPALLSATNWASNPNHSSYLDQHSISHLSPQQQQPQQHHFSNIISSNSITLQPSSINQSQHSIDIHSSSLRPARRPRSPSADPSLTLPQSDQNSFIGSEEVSRATKRPRRRQSLIMNDSMNESPASSGSQSSQAVSGSHTLLQPPLDDSSIKPHTDQPSLHPAGSSTTKLDSLLMSFRDGLQDLGLGIQANGNTTSHLEAENDSTSRSHHPPHANHPPWPHMSDIGREEVVRLLLQGLKEIGYPAAAMTLEVESGFSLDPSTEITALRENILSGRWQEVEDLLKREHIRSLEHAEPSNHSDSHSPTSPHTTNLSKPSAWVTNSLLGVDSEVINMARFFVAQQKYLELLELGQTGKALSVLRRELAPLASPTHPIDSDLLLKMKSSVSKIGTSLNKLSVDITADNKPDLGHRPMWPEDEDEDPGVQRLCLLSSLMMCGSAEEIRERAMWSGVGQGSRIRLLEDLQALIPPEKLLPHRRLSHLLEQSKNLQRLQCLYHVTNPPISLLSNHTCSRFSFPIQTSHVLSQHTDEVWRIEWSHDGTRLASAGRDTRCIIWKLTPVQDNTKHPRPVPQSKAPHKFRDQLNSLDSTSPSTTRAMLWRALSTSTPSDPRLPTPYPAGIPPPPYDESFCQGNGEVTIAVHLVLDGHPAGISCIAWSPDDSVLLTGSDCTIKMWNTRTGDCISTMVKHEYDVSALSWLPDGQGFVSGGMDSDVLFWDLKGQTTFMWRVSPSRVLDLAVSPDGKRLVAIGIAQVNVGNSQTEPRNDSTNDTSNGTDGVKDKQRRIHIFNIAEKREDAMIPQTRELTCVSISDDSKYALINQSPNEVHLYSLDAHCLIRRYVGQKQGEFIIRSCFGGLNRNFILSGSEDSKIYVWHKETGSLIEVLNGHSEGSVNAVAWNPKHPTMFASAGDDHTVRIWQAPGDDRESSPVNVK